MAGPSLRAPRPSAIDTRGARILTSHHIELGAEVMVETRAVGRTARAKVVWRGDDASPQEAAEVVVELIEPSESGSIWGIRFPPRKDKKSIASTPPSVDGAPQAAPPDRPIETSSIAGPENGELILNNTAEPGESLADLPIASGQVPVCAIRIPSAVDPEPRTDSAVDWTDLSAELEVFTSSFPKEARRSQGASDAETAAEAPRPDGPVPGSREVSRLAAFQHAAERMRQSTDEAVSSVSLAAERAVAELRAAREQTEASFRATAEAYDRRLAEQSALSVEDLQRQSESLSETLRQKMQMALDDLQQKGAMELAQSFKETAEAAERGSADHLQQEALGAWKSLTEQLQALVAALVDEAGKRLAEVTQSSVERVAQSAETATEEGRLQAVRALEEQTAAAGRGAGVGRAVHPACFQRGPRQTGRGAPPGRPSPRGTNRCRWPERGVGRSVHPSCFQ